MNDIVNKMFVAALGSEVMGEQSKHVCVNCEDGWHKECSCPDICDCEICKEMP